MRLWLVKKARVVTKCNNLINNDFQLQFASNFYTNSKTVHTANACKAFQIGNLAQLLVDIANKGEHEFETYSFLELSSCYLFTNHIILK